MAFICLTIIGMTMVAPLSLYLDLKEGDNE